MNEQSKVNKLHQQIFNMTIEMSNIEIQIQEKKAHQSKLMNIIKTKELQIKQIEEKLNVVKYNELRLGNYINSAHNGLAEVMAIIPCHKKSIYVSNKNSSPFATSLSIDELNGIPLTEEWLLKLGFEKYKLGFRNGNLWVTLTELAWFGNSEITEIKYVHQLQNLYFALTKEELIINFNR